MQLLYADTIRVSYRRLCLIFIVLLIATSCAKNQLSCDSVKIIAHRGWWKNAEGAENSLASLDQAIILGIDGVELDVRRTVDDSLVIAHDDKHGGYYINKTEYVTLRGVRLCNGELLPTLSEYLRHYCEVGSGKELILDIKDTGVVDLLMAEIDKFDMTERLMMNSGSWERCIKLKSMYPTFNVIYSGGEKTPQEVHQEGLNGISYELSVFKKHAEWVYECSMFGLSTNVWGVKSESDILWCAINGVNYITTDYPYEAKYFLQNYD